MGLLMLGQGASNGALVCFEDDVQKLGGFQGRERRRTLSRDELLAKANQDGEGLLDDFRHQLLFFWSAISNDVERKR